MDAAKNITYDKEYEPIRTVALGIGTYAAQVQTARDKNSIAAWRQAAGMPTVVSVTSSGLTSRMVVPRRPIVETEK